MFQAGMPGVSDANSGHSVFKRLAFRRLRFSQCFYDDVHLNRSVALGIGKHAGGGKLFQESGLKAIQRLSLRTAALGVMLGLYKIASSLLL